MVEKIKEVRRVVDELSGPLRELFHGSEPGSVHRIRPSAINHGMKPITVVPIGIVHSTRKEAEDDNWDSEESHIEIDPSAFTSEALAGLKDFSHAEILFHMDQVDPRKVEKTARHPRNNKGWPKVGIFAQRGKNRPNQIGLTICRILRIDGIKLYVEGLDAIDGTPVLDIKPWVAEFGPRRAVYQPEWISELMAEYWRRDASC